MPWKESNVVTLREEFVLKALGNAMSFAVLCADYGISRKTGYKWLERFRHCGLAGLKDTSRRPRNSPDALTEAIVCELVRIKTGRPATWGPKKVLSIYQRVHGIKNSPSLSSVKRVMDKAGFVTHRKRHRKDLMDRAQEETTPSRSNELWTVDFKGWWKTRNGSICEPLTVRDGFSRFLLDMRAMDSTSSSKVRPVFEHMFEVYGLPEVIRSDNGSPFATVSAPMGLSCLSAWWVTLGIRLDRIAPGHPEQNGAHERIHRDIRAELQLKPADGIEQSQALFDQWRHSFNWDRPHEALGMQTPGCIYKASTRKYDPSPVDISYPPDWLERRVNANGSVKIFSTSINISTAVRGYIVGLQPVSDRLDVWFDYLRLGHIDLHALRFIPSTRAARPSSGRVPARRKEGLASPQAGQLIEKVLPMS